MSCQYTNQEVSDAFDATFFFFEEIFKYDSPLYIPDNKEFMNLYHDQGSMDWRDLYQIDEVTAANQLAIEQGVWFGIKRLKKENDLKFVIRAKDKIQKFNETQKVPNIKKFQMFLLRNGVRHLLLTRTLKIKLCCRIQYDLSLEELVEKVEQGDRKALLKLIRLDSTFLNRHFAMRILKNVELSNDLKLKSDLATALKTPKNFWTLEGGRRNKQDYLALWLLHLLGFDSRPNSVWADFLCSKGFTNFVSETYVAKAKIRYKIDKTPLE